MEFRRLADVVPSQSLPNSSTQISTNNFLNLLHMAFLLNCCVTSLYINIDRSKSGMHSFNLILSRLIILPLFSPQEDTVPCLVYFTHGTSAFSLRPSYKILATVQNHPVFLLMMAALSGTFIYLDSLQFSGRYAKISTF